MNGLALSIINDGKFYQRAMASLKAGVNHDSFRKLCANQVGIQAYLENQRFKTVHTKEERASAVEDVMDHLLRHHEESKQ